MYLPVIVAGIGSEYKLLTDSQDINWTLANIDSTFTYSDYGCLFVLNDDDTDEVIRIYGISGSVPWLDAVLDLIYVAKEFEDAI